MRDISNDYISNLQFSITFDTYDVKRYYSDLNDDINGDLEDKFPLWQESSSAIMINGTGPLRLIPT